MTKTKTKKAKKYYYVFIFDGTVDYLDVREDIMDTDPTFMTAYEGSGYAFYNNAFDISFKCTPAVYKRLAAYVRRHHGDALISVDRYTQD